MALFRILHVSDLHLAVRPRLLGPLNPSFWSWNSILRPQRWAAFSSYNDIILDKLFEYVDLHSRLFDYLVVTGDIANTGTASDMLAAQSLMLRVSTSTTFAQTGVPLRIVPGNHDRYDARHFFDSSFTSLWSAGQSAQRLFGIMRGHSSFVCIGADFSLRDASDASVMGGAFGQGRVYPDALHTLKAETAKIRRDTKWKNSCVIWVVHFPPETGGQKSPLPNELQRQIPQMRLDYGSKLLEAAKSYNVFAIVAGHIHDWASYTATTGTKVSVGATATEYQARHGNWLHWIVLDIEPDGTVRTADIQDIVWNTQFQKWDRFPVTRYFG